MSTDPSREAGWGQKNLAGEQGLFRAIFENSLEAMVITSPDGQIYCVNAEACRILGMSEAEVCQAGRAGVVDQNDPRLPKALEERRRTGQYRGELNYKRKDGTIFPAEFSSAVFRDEHGQEKTIVVFRDITARKAFEAELERRVAERTAKLAEVVEELRHISYSLIHDMRAPLRAIQGYAKLLEARCGPEGPAQNEQFFQRIHAATEYMDLQITDALQYARAVLQEVRLKPVALDRLMRQLVASSPALQSDRAEILIQGELPAVLGNERLLAQCFTNLFGNAVKFVAAGIRPRIRLWAEVREGARAESPAGGQAGAGAQSPASDCKWVRIWMEDNGIGIPQAAQERVFRMFERAANDYEGTGMGLAIVRKVVQRMDGRVGLESQAGQGSRFWVELRAAAG